MANQSCTGGVQKEKEVELRRGSSQCGAGPGLQRPRLESRWA